MIEQQGPAVIHAARRFAAYKRRRRWALVLAFGLLITVAGSGYVLATSQLVALRQLDISLRLNPTSTLTKAQVTKAADIALGRPLIRISPDAVQRKVAALPAVASVTVARSWPHRLDITVVARRAVVVLQTPTHEWLADRSGVVFAAAPLGATSPIPVDVGDLSLRVRSQPWRVAALIAGSVTSIPTDLRSQASGLRFRAGMLRFRIGRIVVAWGGADGGPKKAAELRALLSVTRPQRYATIDLSTVGVVVTRLRKHHAQTSPKATASP